MKSVLIITTNCLCYKLLRATVLTPTATSVKIRGMNTLARFLWGLVWFSALTYLALTLWLGLAGLVYPYQLDYGEGIVLWFAQQLAHSQPIYKGLADFPYASSNYPPVAMLLSAMLMPVFGEGYVSGRVLNLGAALIVAALIFRIVQAETHRRTIAALAALFFLGSPYVYHWIPLFRVDLIGLAVTFAGVYFVWRWEKSNSRFTFCVFTFCFLLALYTKHTLFAAPVAAFLALWTQNRKQALAFALTLGGIGGALYLAFDYATRGGFTLGLIESNATIFLFDQLVALLKNFFATFAILILLAAWALIDRARTKRWGVLEWYALTAFAALGMAGRVGAWENYFFEALVVICVLSSFKFQVNGFNVSTLNLKPETLNLLLPGLLLVQLGLAWHDPRIAADLMARDFPANQQLATLLRQTPGIVLSEDMGALATAGKPVAYYTFQYSSLARSGKWDQRWELDGLRDGAFPLVILERGTREDVDHYRRFTREFVSTLDRYYARTQTIGKYEIYTPAPPLRLQSVEFGNEIALVGWHIEPENLDTATLNLTLVWQAKRAMTQRYTAFVHLEKSNGEKIAQDDHSPRYGAYPTNRWAANEMVREVYTLSMPGNLAAGEYSIKIGWYDSDTGERLPVPASRDDSFELTVFK